MYCVEGARQVAMEEQEGIITLTNENGEEVEYQLIDSITYENAEYVVLLPGRRGGLRGCHSCRRGGR